VHELITPARESDSLICVSQSTDPLRTHIATLQALLAQARAERDVALAERDHLQSQNDRLQHLLRQLQRAQFGRRSEKLDPDRLHLALPRVHVTIEPDDTKCSCCQAPMHVIGEETSQRLE